LVSAVATGQPALPAADWKEWTPMLGEWEADASAPGAATGSFTLATDLQSRVLVRKNFADYPKTASRPGSRHDDLT
jgi:hypothetical protein